MIGASLIKLFPFVVLLSLSYSTPPDKTACLGNDINIPWEYPDSGSMTSVSWEHFDSSNLKKTILLQLAGGNATSPIGFNIQHNTNGNVTITNAEVTNTGTYKITVAYSSGTPTFTDDVVINVYDPPTDFNFTESSSGSQTTFTCIAGSLGDPAADLYIQVNGVNSTVTATVLKTDTVKCFLSGPAVQCMSGVSGTVTSLCAQQCPPTVVTERYKCTVLGNSTAVDSKAKCGCAWFGIIFLILLGVLFLIGLCCGCSLKSASVKEGKSCEDCVNNRYCRCECFASTPCGACCNIKGLPYWYQVLWASVVGSTVAFGIWLAWRPRKNGNNDTSENAVGTGSNPKNAETKLLEKKKQSKSPGKPEDVNKEKPASVKQNQHADQAHKVENEGKKPGRDLPPPPVGANHSSQLPNIHTPGHDNKGRGLSANFGDDDHPLVAIDIPAQKAGALPTIADTPKETKKKTKKKKKDKQEDNQKTETVLDF